MTQRNAQPSAASTAVIVVVMMVVLFVVSVAISAMSGPAEVEGPPSCGDVTSAYVGQYYDEHGEMPSSTDLANFRAVGDC